MDTENIVKGILNKTIKLGDLDISKEQIEQIEKILASIKGNIANHKDSMDDGSKEIMKFDTNGQWSIEKAIKPGPSLDYGEINRTSSRARAESERKASTLDYTDWQHSKVGAGAIARRDAARQKIQTDRVKNPYRIPGKQVH